MESLDLPCRVLIIDAPWHSCFNSFEFNSLDFPAPQEMMEELNRRGYKVLAWMTPHINRNCGILYDHALQHGYFHEGYEDVEWWLGEGGLIDFDNREAVAWWHGLLQRAIDIGFHGFKVDSPGIDDKDYQEKYYQEIYGFSRCLGLITFSRAEGNRGLVGSNNADDRHSDWIGLAEAIGYIMERCQHYPFIGSDIGGWNPRVSGCDRLTDELFCRWVQFAAFCPIMELGGSGCREPWKENCWEDSELVLEVYSKYCRLHENLKDYLAQIAFQYCNEDSLPPMIPLDTQPVTFMLGESFLVAPVYAPGAYTWRFPLPEGRWRYLWDMNLVLQGDRYVEIETPTEMIPVFIPDDEDISWLEF